MVTPVERHSRHLQTMNHYFEVMGHGGDFAEFYTADVAWTTTDTGQDVRGPSSVRDFIVALHNNMSDAQTRRIVVSDGHAYLEGRLSGGAHRDYQPDLLLRCV
jgi:hypothetical protein